MGASWQVLVSQKYNKKKRACRGQPRSGGHTRTDTGGAGGGARRGEASSAGNFGHWGGGFTTHPKVPWSRAPKKGLRVAREVSPRPMEANCVDGVSMVPGARGSVSRVLKLHVRTCTWAARVADPCFSLSLSPKAFSPAWRREQRVDATVGSGGGGGPPSTSRGRARRRRARWTLCVGTAAERGARHPACTGQIWGPKGVYWGEGGTEC